MLSLHKKAEYLYVCYSPFHKILDRIYRKGLPIIKFPINTEVGR